MLPESRPLPTPRAKLAAAEAEIAAGEQAIADGRAKLDAAEKELKDALAALPEQRRQLDAAETELEAGAQELQAGWDEYYAGAAQAETELQDGRQKLLDGEAELEEAKAEIDGQLRLEVYALDRDANSGYLTFENDVNIVGRCGKRLPRVFAPDRRPGLCHHHDPYGQRGAHPDRHAESHGLFRRRHYAQISALFRLFRPAGLRAGLFPGYNGHPRTLSG